MYICIHHWLSVPECCYANYYSSCYVLRQIEVQNAPGLLGSI